MENTIQVFENVVSGTEPMVELRSWVDSVRSLYVRPQMSGLLKMSQSDREKALQAYLDWETREHELLDTLRRAHNVATENHDDAPDLTLKALLAGEILSKLHPAPANHAEFSFRLGYFYWRGKCFAEAVPRFTEAANIFSKTENATFQELNSLSYLVTCLRGNGQYEEALDVLERFLDRSTALQCDACRAMALRDRGMIRSRLGRSGGVEDLFMALQIRRQVSNAEASEYSTPDLSGFLNDVGTEARKVGKFEQAIGAFLELRELQRLNGNQDLEAEALSELGYTYHALTDDARAATYLIAAADLAEQAGEMPQAERWRRQASAFSAGQNVNELDELKVIDLTIRNEWDAYNLSSLIERLLSLERFEEAMRPAEAVLNWARQQNNVDLQMAMLNNLSACHFRKGNVKATISLLHEGIKLANRLNQPIALRMHYNLAKAFIEQGKLNLAVDVLYSALATGQALLDSTLGRDARQQIAASILPIHETLALLFSQTDHHQRMIAMSEMARARNLLTWMRAENAVAEVMDTTNVRDKLKQLLASEVELEVHQLADTTNAVELQEALKRRSAFRSSIDVSLRQRGLPAIPWSLNPNEVLADLDTRLAEAVEIGDRALFLFSVPEGVCAAIAGANSSGVETQGMFIPWDRADRAKALAPWLAVTREHQQSTDDTTFVQQFQAGRAIVRQRLFEPLLDLLRNKTVTNLIVIPQGDIALIPYWDLIESVQASGSLCVAPSLETYLLCKRRTRTDIGPTLLVPDITGSLRFSRFELDSVRSVRHQPIREERNAERIPEAAKDSVLIHICGHGVFDGENPYLSGVIMAETEAESGRFPNYVAAPRSFSSRPTPDSWRLFTVAECMAELSLDRCRAVILSACESGIPRLHGGGELVGLPNSFLLAGAKSVVATLWPIHDAAAAILMHHFYEEWTGGRGTVCGVAESLKKARSRLLNTTRSDIKALLGRVYGLPDGEHPFSTAFFTDAFHCFGTP